MKFAWLATAMATAFWLSACERPDGQDVEPQPPAAAAGAQTHAAAAEVPSYLPRMAYKKGIEQARKAVTAQNAAARLEALAERVEREKELIHES